MCHGATGVGDGMVGAFFQTTKPADLTSSQVQSLTDAEIFLVITNGKDPMPPMAENLTAAERWDLVNYIRTLKK
jgi:mono/diheme cytochrome c family protein